MKKLLFYFALILVISCSSSKKISYNELMTGAPSWVKQTPNSPEYYHGVGMASKMIYTGDFREVARQNALSEMAAGISVNISSTSVLNQFEVDDNYSEYFMDNIKIATQQYLEGYELIDNWENEQQYWVYYRLSKSRFKEIKQQRIDKALNNSKAEFTKARGFKAEGNFQESMRFYIKALDELKDFFGDDLKTDIDGKSEDYSSLLTSEIIRMIPRLSIVTDKDQCFVRGVGHENESVVLTVLYDNKQAVKGVNIGSEFSYAPGKLIQKTSDAQGKIRIKNEVFDTHKKQEYLRASINIDQLVKESTNDQMVRRLLESVEFPVFEFPIEIISPKFFLSANEKNMNTDTKSSIVVREFRKLLTKDGLELVDNNSKADYSLHTDVYTKQNTEVNGKFSAKLIAHFSLKNHKQQIVYSEDLTNISGLGSTYESAGEDAFKSLEGKIKINIYPKMYKAIFK